MVQAALKEESPGSAFYEKASPSLLAGEPANPPAEVTLLRPDLNWAILWGHLEARLSGLRNWRTSWWEHWALLAEYLLPRRYKFLITANTMQRGFPINQNIVDPTGTYAMRVCATGMLNGLMSPSRPWFKLSAPLVPEDQIPRDARIWYEQTEDVIYAIMQGSNFYSSMAQMFEDLVTFGTAPVIIYEDAVDHIRCYNPVAGEYFVGASNAFRAQELYRTFTMTISQIVQMFKLENCPRDVQQLWAAKGAALENERVVAHAIEPNFAIRGKADGDEIDVLPQHFTWREVYWLSGQQNEKPLSLRGFEDTPVIIPRWATTSNDAYGRSVAMDVLQDVIQLQVMTKREAEAIEKQVRPPMLASIDLKNEPASILPGHVTYVAQLGPGQGMRPAYEVAPDLRGFMENKKEIQGRIKVGFFNDLFMLLQNMEGVQPRNQLEISERKAEKLQILGPVIENTQGEAAGPAIKRIYNIADRKGMLQPPPDSVKRLGLEVKYISSLALAQKAALTAGAERVVGMIGQLAGADPEALDLLDDDKFIRWYSDRMDSPVTLLRSTDEIAARRQARAQQAQQQQSIANAGAAVQGAKNLGDTQVGGGQNALQMILGGAKPPAAA